MSVTVEHEVRVRYADTDRMGYAYHANMLVWFEVGRTEWLRAQGLPYAAVENEGFLLPVASLDVRYLRPALYDDVLRIRTTLGELGRASVRFTYEVVRDGEILATGSTLHACTGKNGKVARFPPVLLERLRNAAATHG